MRARARLNENLDPRVVVGQHGWWQACAELGAPGYDPFSPDGANFNLLIGSDARTRSAARPRIGPICARFGRVRRHGWCAADEERGG